MKIMFMFPDYGTQFVGMAKDIYDESRLMQEEFDEASSCLDINFIKLCFASSDNELSKLSNAYPALFLTSSSIARYLMELGIIPDAVVGQGIGELAAICTVKGISMPDGLYILRKYAEIYQEALAAWPVEAISVAGIDRATIKKMCADLSSEQQRVDIALILTDDHMIVTGARDLIEKLKVIVKEADGLVATYTLGMGLHSETMEPVVVHLTKYFEKIDFKDVEIPVMACVDGKLTHEGEMLKRRFIKQLQSRIYWNKIMGSCAEYDLLIQIGPGNDLADLAKATYPDKQVMSIQTMQDIDELKKLIDGYKEIK